MKRKLLFPVLVALFFVFVFAFTAAAVTLGDVNGDSDRGADDARLALRASVDLENYVPGSPAFTAADTNGNGVIEASDARLILRTSVALEDLPEDPAEVIVSNAFADPVKNWADYDGLIARIRAETNRETRTQLMHEAEDMLMATQCIMPLYHYNTSYLLSSKVTGVYANVYGVKTFSYAKKTDNKTFSVCLGPVGTMDPAFVTSTQEFDIVSTLFSGLYTYDAEGKTVPACAESCTCSDDGLRYTVTLKDGLKWSDGSELTAGDFAFAWKRAADPDTGADYGYLFAGFKGYESGQIAVEAPDKKTLTFELIAPCAYMEDLMAFPTFYPVKQAVVENTEGDAWCRESGFICNGAFICGPWTDTDVLTIDKNRFFYNADNVSLQNILFLLTEDFELPFSLFTAGDLDYIDSIPIESLDAVIKDYSSQMHSMPALGTYYFAFNAKSALFRDKTPAQAACIREAISLLTDRKAICDDVVRGGLTPASSFIPRGMADGNGGIFHPDGDGGYYDPLAINTDRKGVEDRAKALLAAAGYTFGEDGKLSAETPLTIVFGTNYGVHEAIANSMAKDLETLGIKLQVVAMGWNAFTEAKGSGQFDLIREGWIADFNDPINMLELFTSDSGFNDCRFGE